MPETWRKIKAYNAEQKAYNAEQEAQLAALAAQEEAEDAAIRLQKKNTLRSHPDEKTAEELEAERRQREWKKYFKRIVDLVTPMLVDLSKTAPRIKYARKKKIVDEITYSGPNLWMGSVSLLWGKKLGPTDTENKILSDYDYRPERALDRLGLLIPDKILVADYHFIEVVVDRNRIENVPAADLFKNPDLLIPSLARQLTRANVDFQHEYSIKIKGEDYWVKPHISIPTP